MKLEFRFAQTLRLAGLSLLSVVSILTTLAAGVAAQGEDYLATPTPAPWQPASAEAIAQGRTDFNRYCAPCHSADGRGNGPEVKVIPGIKPKDLTTISTRNGGVFPYRDVEATIDGRKIIPSHKRFDMPFWGVSFQQQGREFSPESEAKVRQRIDAIVDYIATLQRP